MIRMICFIQNGNTLENITKQFNHPLLPKYIRSLVVGKSGCGKATVLINLLLQSGWLDCNNLNIFGKSLFQSEYPIIKKAFEGKQQSLGYSKTKTIY